MATTEELAIFSFRAYRPSQQNQLELAGWDLVQGLSPANRGAGFDGSVFVAGGVANPTEIVIAFRGTDGPNLPDWTLGNVLDKDHWVEGYVIV